MGSLQEGFVRLNRNLQKIPELVPDNDETLEELYSLLIQAALFSEFGVPTEVILKHVNISRSTLKVKLDKIPSKLLVKEKRGRVNYYALNVQELEKEN